MAAKQLPYLQPTSKTALYQHRDSPAGITVSKGEAGLPPSGETFAALLALIQRGSGEAEQQLVAAVRTSGRKVVVAVNKIDQIVPKSALLPWIGSCHRRN